MISGINTVHDNIVGRSYTKIKPSKKLAPELKIDTWGCNKFEVGGQPGYSGHRASI